MKAVVGALPFVSIGLALGGAVDLAVAAWILAVAVAAVEIATGGRS